MRFSASYSRQAGKDFFESEAVVIDMERAASIFDPI